MPHRWSQTGLLWGATAKMSKIECFLDTTPFPGTTSLSSPTSIALMATNSSSHHKKNWISIISRSLAAKVNGPSSVVFQSCMLHDNQNRSRNTCYEDFMSTGYCLQTWWWRWALWPKWICSSSLRGVWGMSILLLGSSRAIEPPQPPLLLHLNGGEHLKNHTSIGIKPLGMNANGVSSTIIVYS